LLVALVTVVKKHICNRTTVLLQDALGTRRAITHIFVWTSKHQDNFKHTMEAHRNSQAFTQLNKLISSWSEGAYPCVERLA
jgi:hypothetical protein